jgi:hypothetical protein
MFKIGGAGSASPWIELPQVVIATTSTSAASATASTTTAAIVVGVEAVIEGELTAAAPEARRGSEIARRAPLARWRGTTHTQVDTVAACRERRGGGILCISFLLVLCQDQGLEGLQERQEGQLKRKKGTQVCIGVVEAAENGEDEGFIADPLIDVH